MRQFTTASRSSSRRMITSACIVAAAAAPLALGQMTPDDGLRYEPVPGWCKLPSDRPLGNTHGGIVIGPEGQVMFNTDTDRSIMVYTPEGEYVRTFASDYPAIHGMVLRVERAPGGDERAWIYAAHLGGQQAIKIDLEGEAAWTLGAPEASGLYEDKAYRPTAIAVGPDGDVYVADGYGEQWIHQYTADLEYVRSFGGPGTEPGKFNACHGMILDERGPGPATLLICDRENRRIQRFSLEGEFIEVVASDLRRPCSLSIWAEYTAVAELEGRVTILDGDFEVAARLGENPDSSQWARNGVPPAQWTEGVFTAPHGVCFDADGNLYVMDWNATGRMSKLERQPR